MASNVARRWLVVFLAYCCAVRLVRLLSNLIVDRLWVLAKLLVDRARLLSNLLVDGPRLFGH
jgi:hypothetical protein